MPSCPTARRGTVLGAVAVPLDGRTISSARTSSRKPSPGLPMVAPRMTTEEATPKTKGHARSASARCSKLRFAPRLEAVSLRCAESAAGPAIELDGPTVQPANGCRLPALRTDLPRDDLAHKRLRSLFASRNRARGARPSLQAERLPERATHYPPSARSSRVRLTCFSRPQAAAPSPGGRLSGWVGAVQPVPLPIAVGLTVDDAAARADRAVPVPLDVQSLGEVGLGHARIAA
jgi:hypothetical protein